MLRVPRDTLQLRGRVWMSRVDMNNWVRGLRADFQGARHGPGRRISGATHGWPVLSLTACALSAHAITEYGKSDYLRDAWVVLPSLGVRFALRAGTRTSQKIQLQ